MTSEAYKANYDLIDWSVPLPRHSRHKHIPVQRSNLACPMLVRPFSEPVKSMADGKYYDDPQSLRATYRAENNPHGVNFIEVGNEDTTKFTPPKKDRAANRAAIERAIEDVSNGRVPPVLTKAPV